MKHLPAAMQDMLWIVLAILAPTALVFSHLASPAAASGVVTTSTTPPGSPRGPGCKGGDTMCGNVRIPYPFGLSQACALPLAMNSGKFNITCDHSFEPPKPFIGRNLEVLSISLEDGQMVIRSLLASNCYNSPSSTDNNLTHGVSFTFVPPYLISPTSNEFTAIGCDTAALLANKNTGDLKYFTGCISYCASVSEAAEDGDDCVGLGCCKTGIVANLDTMRVFWGVGNTTRRNNAWQYSPCSYAFMAKKGWYNFSRQDLYLQGNNSFQNRFNKETVPLVLDWAIRNGSCVNESGNLKGPACVSNNSTCVDATNGVGYLCNCTSGYTGNPYVHGGCTNIDECAKSNEFPCHGECKDTEGSYECNCYPGYESDWDPKQKPCHPKLPRSAKRIIGITIGTSILLLIILGTGVCYMLKRIEKKAKERELKAIERKNGSERLKNVKTLILFTKEELDQITKRNSELLGKGSFGAVHKGTLSDKTEVAVKASNVVIESTLHKFVKEVEIQSKMMHKNILKLLGCCLRLDVPLLVYEYAAKGSLKDILHGKNNDQQCEPLSLRLRLDIAIGSAQGLAYMHSYTENGIQHADVKPDNILLDHDLVPKISDFGLSKVFIPGKDYTTNVIGCLSYMDPVYKDRGMVTPKSDVYSFGIVLLELICRKPVGFGKNNLVNQFKRVYEKNKTGKVLFDKDIVEEQDMPILDEIGKLAMQCLKGNVNERPTMASLASALVIMKDSWEEKRRRFSSTSIN